MKIDVRDREREERERRKVREGAKNRRTEEEELGDERRSNERAA